MGAVAGYYPAFEISPVPTPALDAAPPEVDQGSDGMPMFVTVSTSDLRVRAEPDRRRRGGL
jgi:hypothetical protein